MWNCLEKARRRAAVDAAPPSSTKASPPDANAELTAATKKLWVDSEAVATSPW
eukprot:CAMPEP_0183365548 /NCGR_PEP_ID=MMETSP0164_2-20130417/85190_1 /TAXON_ID=221442 /ORGANISM="Coccolithus pelagicus ssp braarudi, Strain PLY182g" /LENGTH=52 /DNA_ID=CAMNT_0025541105 /DNA_START=350 /DNA_END=508 /DNA_ORIENTATION=-